MLLQFGVQTSPPYSESRQARCCCVEGRPLLKSWQACGHDVQKMRTLQSVQSVPKAQLEYSEPGPPSWQTPSGTPPSLQVSLQMPGGGDGGDGGDGGGGGADGEGGGDGGRTRAASMRRAVKTGGAVSVYGQVMFAMAAALSKLPCALAPPRAW